MTRALQIRKFFTISVTFLTMSCFAQTENLLKTKHSISARVAISIDDVRSGLGKSFDIAYEHRLWRNLFGKSALYFGQNQQLTGGQRAWFRNGYSGRPQPDEYANYFIGRNSSDVEPESFIQNITLLQLGLTYRFGLRNQFIPEAGFSYGSGMLASIYADNIVDPTTNLITQSSSRTTFARNPLWGFYVGISYAIYLKNKWYVQLCFRVQAVQPTRQSELGNNVAGGVSATTNEFGIIVRKDFFTNKQK